MSPLIHFLPMLLFVGLYVGSGVYFSLQGIEQAFYQISPLAAIIPAIILGWVLHKGSVAERNQAFLDGVRHRDIMTMCMVFLLAGAFSMVTQTMGAVDSTVNLALSLLPSEYLLIGLFLTSGFIATAIGTSMGTVATMAPIAVGLSFQGAFGLELGIATVVGGAMFGDNLSIISDTTIASVMSQAAKMRPKLILNAKIALIAGFITIGLLLLHSDKAIIIPAGDYNFWLMTPYLLLITLAALGINVFVTLILSLGFAGFVGLTQDMSILNYSQTMVKGFLSIQEILILSLMIGGLSGLAHHGAKNLAVYLGQFIEKHGNKTMAQLIIAKIVSVFDILLANNTVAIIFSGEIARHIARKHKIPPHVCAAWLDIFSCVFQGLIPYGAQCLLASAIAGISPLSITLNVYYCYALGLVAISYILCRRPAA